MTATKIGTVGWQDLTVPNAEALRDFYKAVIGWESSPVDTVTNGPRTAGGGAYCVIEDPGAVCALYEP